MPEFGGPPRMCPALTLRVQLTGLLLWGEDRAMNSLSVTCWRGEKKKFHNHRTKERERKRSSLADQLTPEQHHLISALAVRCVLRAAREARLISESQEMGEKHNSCTKYQLLPQYCLTTAAIFPAKSLEPHSYHKFETFVSTWMLSNLPLCITICLV